MISSFVFSFLLVCLNDWSQKDENIVLTCTSEGHVWICFPYLRIKRQVTWFWSPKLSLWTDLLDKLTGTVLQTSCWLTGWVVLEFLWCTNELEPTQNHPLIRLHATFPVYITTALQSAILGKLSIQDLDSILLLTNFLLKKRKSCVT